MAEEENIKSADGLYYKSAKGEEGEKMVMEESISNRFVGLIDSRFNAAQRGRNFDETRWITSYHNYMGLYPKNVRFRESEKSRVFVKITKTKVLAAFGQLVDVIFGQNKIPIGISETKVPEGVAEYAHLDTANPVPGIETSVPEREEEKDPFDVGYVGDDNVLDAGKTFKKGKVEDIDVLVKDQLLDGTTPNPKAFEVKPAQEAARRMEKLIHDQIEESHGSSELRNALFESSLFGTGIIKGPFNFNKTLNRWDENEAGDREYKPVDVRVPRIEFVSIWDFFPDPNATNMEECEYIFHRHKMNRSQIRALNKMPYFDKDAIRQVLLMGPNYDPKAYESELKDNKVSEDTSLGKYEVIEYWGVMDAQYAREVGVELSDTVDDLDEVQVNAWICNGVLLRAVVNPFAPYRIPYHAFPYERNPYSFFGIGVAENMDDSQKIMNGHARMAIGDISRKSLS